MNKSTIEEDTRKIREWFGATAPDAMDYKEIMRADIDALNPEQLSIRNGECVECGEGHIKGNRMIATARNGHSCWIHDRCRI